MRKLLTPFFVLICLFITSCGSPTEINGLNDKTAARSLLLIKRGLLPDKRLEFETAFWTLKDAHRESDDFLDTVDGENVDEIIELGKQAFNERRAMGVKSYIKYSSWEDMLIKVKDERAAKTPQRQQQSERDKKNNVMYQLKNM